jgi:competence protein ComEC
LKIPRSFFILLLIIVQLLSSCSLFSNTKPASPTLTVHFIDVGQGDSILIDCGETEILIDGGEKTPGVVSYLSSRVEGSLEVLVATHTDADHIGGLIEVLAQYPVSDIWVSGYTATSKTFAAFMSSASAEGAAIHEAELGNVIRAGELELFVLNPPADLFSDANNNSVVLTLNFAGIDFLFSGDAEIEAEEAMLLQSLVQIPDVEILKVGHHGSRTASSPEFLALVKPDTAVYMCKTGNKYEHPHQETINALSACGAGVYGTENYGTIIITADSDGYNITTEKTP